MPVTPRKNTSALTRPIASCATAPAATTECLKSRPPTMITSTLGWVASSTAIVGLCVMTVALRSGGQVAGQLARRRTPVDRHGLTGPDERGRRARHRDLGAGRDVGA